MRIRSYLAVLVLACILGAYALEQVLGYHFNNVQEMADKQTKSLLWAKDLERIENSVSQFLVSTDLVVASGNTYLILGAQNMGDYLVTELTKIKVANQFPEFDKKINQSIVNIIQINVYLDTIGDIPANNLQPRLQELLPGYDHVTLALSQDIQFISLESNTKIQVDADYLQQEKQFMNKIGWIARAIFLLLIVALWWWANRKICKPLNGLISSSHKALTGGNFKATNNAPSEIIKLSNDFKLLTKTLSHQASHDPLTELNNRRAFERDLAEVINEKEQNAFLCFIDLDYFKTINDTCGHATGDKILINVAQILKSNVRIYDTVARLGGDEFAILIKDCNAVNALKIANKIREDIHDLTYLSEGETLHLSASIGVASKMPESTMTDLLQCADEACSLAKTSGRNSVQLFDITCENSTETRQDMLSVHQINNALENDLFVLYKQAIFPLQDSKTGKHFEILLRMINNNGELVKPACFLPIAERYQLCCKIDFWVVNAVCDYFIEHFEQLNSVDSVSINLSVKSLSDDKIEKLILSKILNNNLPAEKFCFEVTEEIGLTNMKRVHLFMDKIKAIGCKFALDNYSGSHSSYSLVKSLPIDKIKIDGEVVSNMMNNPLDFNTVKSICENSNAGNQEVIAENVEKDDVIASLTELGVDYAQGSFFNKPEPLIKLPMDIK